MIWSAFRQSRAQAAQAPETEMGCPDDVWAARDRMGPVPVGWVGLRVAPNGQHQDWIHAGQSLRSPSRKSPAGTVWWVRAVPWTFRFAPWPGLAPEAGLEATVELDCLNPDGRVLLALALCNAEEDVTGRRLAMEWSALEVVKALPTCVQPAELASCAEALEQRVWPVLQLRVLSLRRVDLSLPLAISPSQSAPTEGAEGQEVAGGAAPSSAESITGEGAQTTDTQTGPSLHQLREKDRQTWALVARELPRLGVCLERCWAGGGWSTEPAVANRQRAVAQRMGLMAGKLGSLPVLSLPKGSNALNFVARHRLAWAHSAEVLDALANTQVALAALPQGRVPPDEHLLQVLERAVEALDERVHERLHPWWE